MGYFSQNELIRYRIIEKIKTIGDSDKLNKIEKYIGKIRAEPPKPENIISISKAIKSHSIKRRHSAKKFKN